MKITHSLHEGTYRLFIGTVHIGWAIRAPSSPGKFFFSSAVEKVADLTMNTTMANLKVQVLAHLEREKPLLIEAINASTAAKKVAAESQFSVRDAIKLTGSSHNAIRHFMDEIKIFHTYMKKGDYGPFIARRHFEGLAGFNIQFALDWLRRNPTLGLYRPVSEAEYEAGCRLG